ncbi:YlmH/Sll1252 family protein [Butyrivibrio proteoclasticus]|uniref:YlmH/Sll1252 family protein n=1 Tax=Butyrivibrio proteoclasticus TaxID=43305 RepID=UPI00054DB766|nr:YlmH/Sll1252 family protein [Butyrivibrio proteoclasticus]
MSDFLEGRIKDIANRAFMNNFVTHTSFLSESEIASFYALLSKEGVPSNVHEFCGAKYLLYGGTKDSQRQVICFLPDYMDEESFLMAEEAEPSVLFCLKIEPLNAKFSDDLNHRDYLGSVMNLGIERDQIGDIFVGEKEAYLFALPDIARMIEKELVRIRHTSVKCSIVKPSECDIQQKFDEISGSVASERIDAIVAFVYHLSRSDAQKLIESESIFIDGRTAYSGGYDLKAGARVSVKGYGKFIYCGTTNTTRKGRLFVNVKKYV